MRNSCLTSRQRRSKERLPGWQSKSLGRTRAHFISLHGTARSFTGYNGVSFSWEDLSMMDTASTPCFLWVLRYKHGLSGDCFSLRWTRARHKWIVHSLRAGGGFLQGLRSVYEVHDGVFDFTGSTRA